MNFCLAGSLLSGLGSSFNNMTAQTYDEGNGISKCVLVDSAIFDRNRYKLT